MDFTVLAAGNRERGDDAIGIYAGELLEKNGFSVIYCGLSPENFLGRITTGGVLLLDAALIEEDFMISRELGDFPSVSTHGMSLKILQDYLSARGIGLAVAGIRPESMEYGEGLSEKAKERARALIETIIKKKSVLFCDDT